MTEAITDVIIVTEPGAQASPCALALQQVIAPPASVQILPTTAFAPSPEGIIATRQAQVLYCPLTLALPPCLQTPLTQACADVAGLRQWVVAALDYGTATGDRWLPVVLTARGPLYAEVIAPEASGQTRQPWHLTDDLRQPLYHLAFDLLEHLGATPGVYMLQFAQRGAEICFDRLWPFPTASAIASRGVQEPDLFTCHWRCLTEAPILDLCIPGRYADAL